MARSSHDERKVEVLALLARVVDLLIVDHGDRDFYSTDGEWPPGCRSRRAARDRIRAVEPHERVGSGRATVFRCARSAYDAHWVRRRTRVVGVDAEDLAARAIDRAGLRATRRT